MNPTPLSTINDLFCHVSAAANPRAILWQDEVGNWQPLSSDQIYHRVHVLAEAFLSWGAIMGDRVALISENRWEWAVADFAILAINGVNVPIYPTLTGEQIALLLADAGCRIAVVSTRQQFDKLNAARSKTQLDRILMMDGSAPEGAIAFSKILAGADEAGSYRDPVFDALVRSVDPQDLATLIYTSGTTGEPKGVMLTHGNIAANQNFAAREFNFDQTDACISFLPLSHITARALDYVMYGHGAQVAYCSNFDKLPQSMKEVRPTVFVGVPRVYEKIRQAVEQKSAASPVKKRMLAWAIGVGGRHRRFGLRWPTAIYSFLETCQQTRLQQGARSFRRPRPHLGIRRCAPWHRHRKVVCLRGHRRLGGLRPHRDLARHRPQQPCRPSHGRRR